jgi:hypothetical protein
MRASAQTLEIIRLKAALWLRQGISPGRLALTLTLGFVIGCIPLLGLPTALCAVVALAFRLNQPAIQAANYAAMPFQVALIVPFVRLGGKLVSIGTRPGLDMATLTHSPSQLIGHSSSQLVMQLGGMAAQALLAWLLIAIPVVLLLTPTLAAVLRRVPALAEVKSSELA